MRKLFAIFLTIFFFSSGVLAADFPEHTNFVNDATSTLSPAVVEELNAKLKNYEADTGTEIAVAVIDSTEGMPIAQYATKLGNEWGVGKAQTDNGALLVIAVSDRELFIAVGSQLEGALTDIEASEIIEEVITPRFKNGDYDEGVSLGIQGIIQGINGESFTNLRTETGGGSEADIGGIIFFAIFFVFPWLAAILGRSKAIWPGAALGAVGGSVGGLILSFALWGIVAAALGLGVLGLIFDSIVSKNYQKAGKGGHVAWWAGGGRGGFGGGGFGGFGGGGFSGGGFGGKW
jgi:uncharacterized protein